jgi:formylglycine-generating enzyme required for sulfatase activity
MHGKDLDPAAAHRETDKRSRRTTPPESTTSRTIDPFPFEPAHPTPPARPSRHRAAVGLLAAALLSMLLCSLWFVFTARQLRLDIQPEPDRVDVQGALLTPRLRGYYLLRPGAYHIRAFKTGYAPLEIDVAVANQERQALALTMEKLPGRLDITVHEADRPDTAVDQARVLIDRTAEGVTPLKDLLVAAGEHHLRIEADRYRPLETTLTVEGMDRRQRLTYALAPDYAQVTVVSDPPEAVIQVDGVRQGLTPVTLPMAAGQRKLELQHPGYKPWIQTIPVAAGPPVTLETAVLEPLDGRLAVKSQPEGASVMVGSQYRGQTPLAIDLPPDTPHRVQLSKSGYAPASREITLTSGEETVLQVELEARMGVVHLRGAPQGASLWVDGRPRGPVPEQLALLAVPHRIEIRKEGFTPLIHRITPQPGYPIELSARLKRTNATEVPGVIRAPNGYRLKLIPPAQFQMGASRREQGRRANETLRLILLTRPFFMGLREVSNREFRAFDPGHDSGSFKGTPLNLDDQPVVQVTWEQAARFCNWLSLQEGLAPVYRETNGTLRPMAPMGNGYRLPTEAEWEFCARYGTAARGWKYPWGTAYPPPAKSVNIADASAAGLMNLVVEKYDDTFPAAAPVGSFPPNPDGLFDLGGNVAEWCHDFYSIYPAQPGVVATDPGGPAEGQHHIIRGSSWQDASIRTLRAAYRDYQDEARPDLGFRICRYTEPAGGAP